MPLSSGLSWKKIGYSDFAALYPIFPDHGERRQRIILSKATYWADTSGCVLPIARKQICVLPRLLQQYQLQLFVGVLIDRYPLQARTMQGIESSCPLLKKDFGKNYCQCPLLKKQLPQKYSSCLLLKKLIKNKYFSCLLFLTATNLSSAILKSDDSFDKIILKSCSMWKTQKIASHWLSRAAGSAARHFLSLTLQRKTIEMLCTWIFLKIQTMPLYLPGP